MPPCPHSYRLPCSLSRGTRKHGASLHRRRILVLAASFISIGQQWRRETRFSSGRESLLRLGVNCVSFFSRRLSSSTSIFFFLTSSFLFIFASSRAFVVKGEVAGGINLRTREEQHSNMVESRRTAGVTGVSAYYSRERELSSLKLAPLLF